MTKRLFFVSIMVLMVALFFRPAAGQSDSSADRTKGESLQVNAHSGTEQATHTVDKPDSHSGGPKIFLPETIFDFGTMTQGSKKSHTFIVRNTGDAPLKLIKAKGS